MTAMLAKHAREAEERVRQESVEELNRLRKEHARDKEEHAREK